MATSFTVLIPLRSPCRDEHTVQISRAPTWTPLTRVTAGRDRCVTVTHLLPLERVEQVLVVRHILIAITCPFDTDLHMITGVE
ncbi:hypothetical protein [Ferrimicrobium sp.]|uniref:hypothetical protein n=1 Tax=Ferrimicrobium sp. TaxID=2926050 RepID=UPI0026123E73|nr:hypothetical protein [Ferrimicrobium sp.]